MLAVGNALTLYKDAKHVLRESLSQVIPSEKKSVIIIGKTGVGKSTLIHLLARKKLEAFEDPAFGETKIRALSSVPGVKISCSCKSETSVPTYWLDSNGEVYWDCPGFSDNRSFTQELENAFCLQKLINQSRELKFIIVAEQADIYDERAVEFMRLIKVIDDLFGKQIDQIKGSLFLVITHLDRDNIKEKNQFRNMLSRIVVEQELKGSKKAIVEALINNPENEESRNGEVGKKVQGLIHRIENSPIYLFKAWGPSGNMENWTREIASQIGKSKYVEGVRAGLSLSQECQETIFQCHNLLITDTLSQIDSFVASFATAIEDFALKSLDKSSIARIIEELGSCIKEERKSIFETMSSCIEIAKKCGQPIVMSEKELLKKVKAIAFFKQFLSQNAHVSIDMQQLKNQMLSTKEALEVKFLQISRQESIAEQNRQSERVRSAESGIEEAMKRQKEAEKNIK